MGLGVFRKQSILALLVLPLWLWDAKQKFSRVGGFLKREDRALEIGSGLGSVTHYFRQEGFNITPLDIDNFSLFEKVQPLVYDGQQLPFEMDNFDQVLLLTVLHHTSNPVQIIQEAVRVGKVVIIIEDVYLNWLQKYLTFWVDSLVNLEFFGHPHSNKTDEEWKDIFSELNLKLTYSCSYRFLLFFRQVVYVLEK